MIVKRTTSRELINKVLKHPDIYDVIGDDNAPKASEVDFPIDEDHEYIAGFVDGEIIGLLVYHSYKDGKECHVQVLPEFRKEYAVKFGEQALKYKGDLPLYAEIPKLYSNVLDYALLNGFEVIGLSDDLYIKNGVEYPIDILKYKG